MQLFFVISGYLIFQSAQHNSLKAYYCHRLLRIFPVYIFLYIGLGVVLGVIDLNRLATDWPSVMVNLLSLQHIFPAALVGYDVFHVSWTLTVELFWYLIAPMFVILIRVYPKVTLLISAAISLGFVALADQGRLDFIYADQVSSTGFDIEYFRVFFLNNAFPSILIFFLLGAVVSEYRETLLKIPSAILLIAFLSLSVALSYLDQLDIAVLSSSPNFLAGIGLAALLLLSMKCLNFKLAFIKHIADISYSFYLVHFTVILYLANNYLAHPVVQSLLALVVIIVISSVLFFGLEKPFMRMAKRIK